MDDVRETQDRFDRAELTADRDVLHDLIAEDFLSIGPRGFVLDKQQWIGRHDEFHYEQLETSEMDVRSYGDTAVVRNVQRNRATYQGRPTAVAVRVGQVWVRRDERWQLVAIQFSPLAEEPHVSPGGAAR
jgi:ketosteroid isomerase-like protein